MFRQTAPTRNSVRWSTGGARPALLDLAVRNRWNTRVLGQAPMPRAPMFVQNWWVIPLELDKSPLPPHARERIRIIQQSGVKVRGYIAIHDPQAALPAPSATRNDIAARFLHAVKSMPWKRMATMIASLVGAALTLVVAIGAVVAIAAAVLTALMVALVPLVIASVAGLMAIDPFLVAVTEDDYWIVIDQWWTN